MFVAPILPFIDVPMQQDIADLKAGPNEDVDTRGSDGNPVGVVETSRDEVEAQEAFQTA